MRISLEKAADLLKSGHVVAVPTETVYGLGASLYHPEAIKEIFKIKGRPPNNPLIIHVTGLSDILPLTKALPPKTAELTHAFWPGPLTLVLPAIEELVPFDVRAGLPTVAFRVPNHPLALELLRITGPLVMPSANKSGKPSSTLPEHIEEDFGESFPILDGGVSKKGLESTILIYHEQKWRIIRLGALPPESFASILGVVPQVEGVLEGNTPLCPGQFYRHYAPLAKLVLAKEIPKDGSGVVLGFSDRSYSLPLIPLGPTDSPEIVAQNLYANLRLLDQKGISYAWVDVDFPRDGLWLTILERLKKASLN